MFPTTPPDSFVKKEVNLEDLNQTIIDANIDQDVLNNMSNFLDIQLQDMNLPSDKRVEYIRMKDYINSGQAKSDVDKLKTPKVLAPPTPVAEPGPEAPPTP